MIIRAVIGDELFTTAFPLRAYALDGTPGAADPARWAGEPAYLRDCLVLVLFDDEIPRATATSVPLSQTVRGKLLPAAGIGHVATHPAARRRGFQTRVISQLLTSMRERGQAAALLYPSRESFYATFGFVGLPGASFATIRPDRLAALVRQSLPGEVELLPLREGFQAYRDFLARLQPTTHGFALGPASLAAHRRDRPDSWVAFAHVDDVIAGAMTYKISRFGGELRADEFLTADGAAKYLLLQWLARHAEQVETIAVILPPAARLETWLSDLQATITLAIPPVHRTPMARIVSLDALTGLQVGSGRFTARIIDRWCPWNEGVFEFSADDGQFQITPADTPDCELAIEAITALVYAGYDPDDFAPRGWGTTPPAVRAAMRTMFPPALPFIYERF